MPLEYVDVEFRSKMIANIEKMQKNFRAARGELKISCETEDILSTLLNWSCTFFRIPSDENSAAISLLLDTISTATALRLGRRTLLSVKC